MWEHFKVETCYRLLGIRQKVSEGKDFVEFSYLHNGLMTYS